MGQSSGFSSEVLRRLITISNRSGSLIMLIAFCILTLAMSCALLIAGAVCCSRGVTKHPEPAYIPPMTVLKVQNMSAVSNRLVRRLPRCLVIGVRKGGTRALLTFLDLHPDIVTVFEEQHFFGLQKTYMKGLSFYRLRMPLSYPHQLTVEKTPEYFTQYLTPGQVYGMNSSIRLLLTVRDPVTRLVSDYAMKKEKAQKNKTTYPSLKSKVLDAYGNVNASERAVNISTYHIHLSRWLEFFPRTQIHVVDGEKLITEPHKEMYKVEEFLGIQHFVRRDKFFFNETKGFYCVKDRKEPMCLGATKGRKHPDVKPVLLKKLSKYFKPKNELFFKLIGRRFNWQ